MTKSNFARAVLLSATFFCAAVFVPSSEAELIITGDVGAGTGKLIFSNDITFDIEANGVVGAVVFDEWVTSDGTGNVAPMSPDFAYSVNDGATQTVFGALLDNRTFSVGDFTANDGYIYFTVVPVVTGNTFTVKAGMYDMPARPGFNPALNNSTFNGSMFLTDSGGVRLSNVVSAIPEPTSFAMFGIAILGMSRRRRLK